MNKNENVTYRLLCLTIKQIKTLSHSHTHVPKNIRKMKKCTKKH